MMSMVIVSCTNTVIAFEIISYGRKDIYLDYESKNDWLAVQAISDVAGIKKIIIAEKDVPYWIGQAISFAIYYDYPRQLPNSEIVVVPETKYHKIKLRATLTPSPVKHWASDPHDNTQKHIPEEPLKTALDFLSTIASWAIKLPLPPIPWGLIKTEQFTKIVHSDERGFTIYYNYDPSLQGVKYSLIIIPNPIIEEGFYWIIVYTEASAGYYMVGPYYRSPYYHDEYISIWLSAGFTIEYAHPQPG